MYNNNKIKLETGYQYNHSQDVLTSAGFKNNILIVLFFLSWLLFSSCATMLNKSYDLVILNSQPKAIIVNRVDTLQADSLGKTKLRVLRKNEDVNIYIKEDDSIYNIIPLKHVLDEIYYFNFMNYGFGYLIDIATYKKWGYPENVYSKKWVKHNPSNTVLYFNTKPDLIKNQIRADISFPYFNWFMFDANQPIQNFGFVGLSYGLDYIYAKNMFVNFKASVAIDNRIPIPLAVEKFDYDTAFVSEISRKNYSAWLSIMNFHQYNNFSLGYGITYGHNHSYFYKSSSNKDTSIVTKYEIETGYNCLGMQFALYYGFLKYIQLGVIYRPTFYYPKQNEKWSYEQLISIDFGIKIPNSSNKKK